MTIAVFDAAAFKTRYPVFAAVPDATLSAYFDDAGLYLSNTDTSPVQDIARRTKLLWLLTAHIAVLEGVLSTQPGPAGVGRTSSATEGSVSVSLDYLAPTPGSGPWFNQTQYGAMFWQATTSLRGFRYRPRPTVW